MQYAAAAGWGEGEVYCAPPARVNGASKADRATGDQG